MISKLRIIFLGLLFKSFGLIVHQIHQFCHFLRYTMWWSLAFHSWCSRFGNFYFLFFFFFYYFIIITALIWWRYFILLSIILCQIYWYWLSFSNNLLLGCPLFVFINIGVLDLFNIFSIACIIIFLINYSRFQILTFRFWSFKIFPIFFSSWYANKIVLLPT